MGEVSDPWKPESLLPLTEAALHAPLNVIEEKLKKWNWNGFRIPVEQADLIYRRILNEHGSSPGPLGWDVISGALALAGHPEIPALIASAFGRNDFDWTTRACHALLELNGMPDLLLIWVDELDSEGFEEMPEAARDCARGIDLTGTWKRTGIHRWFEDEDAGPRKLELMIEAFGRMGMPSRAAALREAAWWWDEMQEVQELNLPEAERRRRHDPLHEKWEAAAWRMNDNRNSLLEGIVRFAVRHRTQIRECLGWTAPPPHRF